VNVRLRLFSVAIAGTALLAEGAAFAQDKDKPSLDRGPEAGEAPPPAKRDGGELLTPTPNEWKLRYNEARARFATGDFAEAASRFAELEASAANRTDRVLAHEQRTLASEWAARGLTFVHQKDVAESNAPAKAVDHRTTDEIVILYTNGVFYGIGSGIMLAALTEPKTPAAGILPTLALTGASIGTIAALDSGRGFRYGVPQSIVSGMYIGLEEGIAWTVWHNNRRGETDLDAKAQGAIIWSLTTAGAVSGGLMGHYIGTTPGRAGWVGSSALWTGLLAGFVTGAIVEKDDPPPGAFAATGVGLTIGTGIGIATAAGVSPTISRVRYIDLGGVSGGLLAAGIYYAVANEKTDGKALSAVTALGIAGGLGTGWAVTTSLPEDRPRPPRDKEDDKDEKDKEKESKSAFSKVRPMLMPSQTGAMMGVGGFLD
jgi:hypothetical protein